MEGGETMVNEEPDAACSAEELAAKPTTDADMPPIGSYEYAQWILELNRKRNTAAGGNKNGR